MMTQLPKLKTIKGGKPKEVEVLTLEQLEVGVDLLEEVEVEGDLPMETKTGIEKGKKSMKNGIRNKTLALMIKEVENTGLKITGEGVEIDQIDPIKTPNQIIMTEIMMTEIMMIGKEQEALHQVEEEIETDMRRETTVPAMRRGEKEEEEEEAEAIAQMIETGGDTIA